MKVALCLHGYFGTISAGDYTTSRGGYKHIKERILTKCDSADIFVHCWQPEFKKDIEDFYSPKCAIYEEQIDFQKVCDEKNIDQSYIDEGFPRQRTFYKNAIASRILSFYYSRCEAIKMAHAYETKNNIEYDWILTTRFDISQRGGSEVNRIRFAPEESGDYLYTTYWDQMNSGYGDMWFYGSSKIMKIYSGIYDSALNDFKARSDYEKMVIQGIPDSQFFNCYDVNDRRQFSNECIKPEEQRSKNLMYFPRWRMTDSHLHHKWFCIENKLYEKTRWC